MAGNLGAGNLEKDGIRFLLRGRNTREASLLRSGCWRSSGCRARKLSTVEIRKLKSSRSSLCRCQNRSKLEREASFSRTCWKTRRRGFPARCWRSWCRTPRRGKAPHIHVNVDAQRLNVLFDERGFKHANAVFEDIIFDAFAVVTFLDEIAFLVGAAAHSSASIGRSLKPWEGSRELLDGFFFDISAQGVHF